MRGGRLAHLRAALSLFIDDQRFKVPGEEKKNRTTQESRCFENRLGRQL